MLKEIKTANPSKHKNINWQREAVCFVIWNSFSEANKVQKLSEGRSQS